MSDFLKNLRSSNKQDKSSSRKKYDAKYYPQNNRRSYTDRRSNHSNDPDTQLQSIKEILLQMVDNSSTFIDHFEKMLKQNDLLFQAKIRQCDSTSLFFDNLNKIITEDFSKSSRQKRSKATASYASGTHYTKDDILNIIKSMREQGATYSIIAEFLKEKGIPTFSNRGQWHAQTVHRLCKQI